MKYYRAKDLTFIVWFSTSLYDIDQDQLIELDDSVLKNSFEDLLPRLDDSEYKKDMFYYRYDKKATDEDNTHIVFILSSSK